MPSDAGHDLLTAHQDIGFLAGLKAEAACLRRGVSVARVAVSAGDAACARAIATRLVEDGAKALVSFGMAGGLDPALRPGDLVIGSSIALPDGRAIDADRRWWPKILSHVTAAQHGTVRARIVVGQVYGSNAAILSPIEKRELFVRTESVAVDLESGAVASVAAEHRLPFAVVRAIADPSHRPVPPLALAGMGPRGEMRPWAVIGRLVGAPRHLPALIRLGRDTRRSLAALRATPWALIAEAAPICIELDG